MSHRVTSYSNIEPPAPLIDIATRNVIQLAPDDSVGNAARIMSEKRISSIVVTDETGHPVGIITERNILQAMRAGSSPDTPLRDTVSTPVIVMSGASDCMEAYRTCLREGIRHLVLTDGDGVLSGVVSETDFRLHLNLTALAGRRKVTTVAKRTAITLPPDNNLLQALDLMQTQQKSCVVVVEKGRPVGIVTERDVVRFYSKRVECDHIVLSDVMISPVLTISENASTNEAAEQMLARKVRHLVVVDDNGSMVGLVSEHDLTQSMVFSMAEERAGIEESFLHTLIDTIPDLIWLKDENGVYLACNHRFEQFFGAAQQDIVGKTDYDFVPKELGDLFRGYDRKAMEKNAPSINEEWVTYASDGHRELLETIKTPMRDNRGRLIGVLGVARDITERKRTENALYFVAQR
jgi:PAS domain S-box-containing protein